MVKSRVIRADQKSDLVTSPVLPLCSKDVRLPVQLQRAMAAEAEAAREARAKVSYFFCQCDQFSIRIFS